MVLVKICGIKDVESAQVALDAGANLIGMILVPGKKRTIDHGIAKEITQLVKSKRFPITSNEFYRSFGGRGDSPKWFEEVSKELKEKGPFSVGVFKDQSIEEINKLIDELDLDFVQLHGKENHDDYIPNLKVPTIARFIPDEDNVLDSLKPNKQILSLFDSEAGGEGIKLNWENLSKWANENNAKYILAGGLTPENVSEAIKLNGVIGVDVSGGVETDGVKDHSKIIKFIQNTRSL
ncbi:hypothetical protein BN7_4702 [Wickerhamomyces ciferrii]|uniref:N-(5'-phosphoribosyl)anthranilate isomerase n=1 Tax=Wickerhamomyces ciferrii (strain ATCC 14091 / BCRC 22168 / CBS 111 / JCM 3599 / NBRC 0793 / NRRL Y-1031 F-60-10) TaxID=1206466 RepID=K0KVE6_WICCF|nr:uncharacterized protein BN7_4702 [Wickerhamomyces ciferrii]CCH45123.1 hypothetical protein BN7_4702 [Wickerhamomyces ciferrii]